MAKNPKSYPVDVGTPSLRASAFTPLLRHFRNKSELLAPILAAQQLKLSAIRDPYTIVPLAAFFSILEDAALAARDPNLGAQIGLSMTPADLGPAGIVLSQSSTIRAGLNRFSRSLAALQGATEMTFEDDGDVAQLSYQVVSSAITHAPQDTEFSLSCMCQILRLAFDRRWHPLEVQFQHYGSSRKQVLEKIFGAQVSFGQSANRIVLPQGGLDIHYRDEDRDLIHLIERHIAELAEATAQSLTDRVTLIVRRRLGQNKIDLQSIARELGLAPRTLQRRLTEEGTSVRQIVKNRRMKIAQTQLQDPNVRVLQVAQSMGYSDATAFGRAYREWFDRTPKYRSQEG